MKLNWLSTPFNEVALFFIVVFLVEHFSYSQHKELQKYLIPIDKIGLENSSLRLDGFYYTKEVKVRNGDTLRFIAPLILFENGTAHYWDYIGDGQRNRTVKVKGKKCSLDSIGNKSFKPILEYTECFLHSLKYKEVKSIYSVNKRAIKIQNRHLNNLSQLNGLVINDTTFVFKKFTNYNNKDIRDFDELWHFYKAKKPNSSKMKPKKFYKQKISPK
jgi:hypothetical protein